MSENGMILQSAQDQALHAAVRVAFLEARKFANNYPDWHTPQRDEAEHELCQMFLNLFSGFHTHLQEENKELRRQLTDFINCSPRAFVMRSLIDGK